MLNRVLFIALIVLAPLCASTCLPDVDVGLKPSPPPGYTDVARACICDAFGVNCAWGWVGIKSDNGSADILDSITNYNPGGFAQRNRDRAAQIAATEAQTRLIQEQTRVLQERNKALAAENAARSLAPSQPVETAAEPLSKDMQIQALRSMLAAARRHQDFFEVIDRPNSPVLSPVILEFMTRSKFLGEMTYWLAEYPVDLQRIADLPRKQALSEMSLVESRVSLR
jgi:hypothetical protein